MSSCRSEVSGTGTAGVCNTTEGECEPCKNGNPVYGLPDNYNNCPGLYNYCVNNADNDPPAGWKEAFPEYFTGASTDPEWGEEFWYCARAACTPWDNVYDFMGKVVPEATPQCSAAYDCDYELTGVCQPQQCAVFTDCYSAICDTSVPKWCDEAADDGNGIGVNTIAPYPKTGCNKTDTPYLCATCSTDADCPIATEGEVEYECMTEGISAGACLQIPREGLTWWAILLICFAGVVFIGVLVAFLKFVVFKKEKQ